ncbi:MAG: type IX secretion system membrane protein PorP/SprF [Bacteroidetes bacterium]|nr:type IX secretion system membrane protein PorP/SprF [Bacteroidota bacterium]
MITRSFIEKYVLVLLGFCYATTIKAQDPHFAQFYANPIYLNPAFAGSQGCPRICMNYRNQWPNIAGTFVTTSSSFDTRVNGISGGLGFHFLNDQAGQGTLRSTRFSAMYAYQTNITREFSMAFGLQATYGQKKMDWSKLTFGDMIDPKYGFSSYTLEQQPNKQVVSYPDFSAGVLGYSKRVYAGFSVAHLTQPNESLISGSSPLPRKYNGHAGAVIPLDGNYGKTTISPNIIYQQQGNFRELNIGLYLTKGSLVGGLWYRTSDAVVLLIGFQQNAVRLGYSYDITVSKLGTATAGSHEISLQLSFKCKPRHKGFRTVICPSF